MSVNAFAAVEWALGTKTTVLPVFSRAEPIPVFVSPCPAVSAEDTLEYKVAVWVALSSAEEMPVSVSAPIAAEVAPLSRRATRHKTK